MDHQAVDCIISDLIKEASEDGRLVYESGSARWAGKIDREACLLALYYLSDLKTWRDFYENPDVYKEEEAAWLDVIARYKAVKLIFPPK